MPGARWWPRADAATRLGGQGARSGCDPAAPDRSIRRVEQRVSVTEQRDHAPRTARVTSETVYIGHWDESTRFTLTVLKGTEWGMSRERVYSMLAKGTRGWPAAGWSGRSRTRTGGAPSRSPKYGIVGKIGITRGRRLPAQHPCITRPTASGMGYPCTWRPRRMLDEGRLGDRRVGTARHRRDVRLQLAHRWSAADAPARPRWPGSCGQAARATSSRIRTACCCTPTTSCLPGRRGRHRAGHLAQHPGPLRGAARPAGRSRPRPARGGGPGRAAGPRRRSVPPPGPALPPEHEVRRSPRS